TSSDLTNMLQAFDDTNETLKKYSSEINLYREKPLLIADIEPRGFEVFRFSRFNKLKEITYPVK
ncbi:MAG TPA: hypothetical protein VJ044_13405, partial [Candidatus Hodarchaeales archaeon]|nr:hypothetical protein [Candidatus Hodarchaeales archaeon]